MEQYQLILKNSRLKTYYTFAWISLFLTSFLLLGLSFTSAYSKLRFASVVALAVIFLTFIASIYNSYDRRKYLWAAYITLVFMTITTSIYWASCIIFLLALLFDISTKKYVAIFVKKHINFPSFPAKKITWSELNSVIVKDDILTIDFKNDKIIQAEIVDEDTFTEQEFNDFCQQQLNK